MKALLSGCVLAGALVFAGASTPASALPIGPNPLVTNLTTADVTPVRWACDPWGRCWRRPGPRWGWAPPPYPGPRWGWGPPPYRRWGPPPYRRYGWGPPGPYRGW
jgi:hypothetical protein